MALRPSFLVRGTPASYSSKDQLRLLFILIWHNRNPQSTVQSHDNQSPHYWRRVGLPRCSSLTNGLKLTFLASPGGLVALNLREASTPVRPIGAYLFEAYVLFFSQHQFRRTNCVSSEADIGGTFNYHSYQSAELVSSRQLTSFSDHRFPRGTPDHVSLPDYVNYWKSYIERFDLGPYIKLNCPVVHATGSGIIRLGNTE